MNCLRPLAFGLLISVGAFAATAQETSIPFGTFKADPTLPVEVTSDTLDVNQTDGSAEFIGNVLVDQGEMHLSANKVLVIYNQEASTIQRMRATGDVILINGPDAAESDLAVYTIETGIVVMTGNVLLTQGPNVLTSDRMTVNLVTGTAKMIGRVKTILNPGTDE